MTDIAEPKVAFYLRIKANCIKQTFAIIKSLTSKVTMLVNVFGITISTMDRYKSSGHEIFLSSDKISGDVDCFYINEEEDGKPPLHILAFDPTILYQNLKRVNRNDIFELWYHLGGSAVLSMRIKNERGVSYIPLQSHDSCYKCNIASKTPNVILNSKVFSEICTTCHNIKCSKLKIEGYTSQAIFKGIDTDKTSLYECPVGTFDQCSKKTVEANLISQVFKPLNKFSAISNKGNLSFYFDTNQIVIQSEIDRYGTYLITIPKAEDNN